MSVPGTGAATAAVLAANASFYRAMRQRDFEAMDQLWARRRKITCTHPGWEPLSGRERVMESWQLILGEIGVDIQCSTEQACIFGQSAMVLCVEQVGRARAMASNTFVREDGAWKMLNHQAAPFRG